MVSILACSLSFALASKLIYSPSAQTCISPEITQPVSPMQPAARLFSKMGAPVIVCGKTEHIGKGVIAGLKPEYDVIHFVMSPESGAVQIPALLKGEKPPSSDSELGSKDYSKPPVAIIMGGGFDEAAIDVMRRASEGIRPLPWLRTDLTKPAPSTALGPEYGKAMVARVKESLARLEKEGKMNEDKIVLF